jgi:WD40 repeat protein
VRGVTLLKNGQLASAGQEKTVKIWNHQTKECLKTLTGHTNHVVAILALQNGQVASGSEDNTVKIWDAETGECVRTLDHKAAVFCLTQLDNGHLVSGGEDKTLKIWNLDDGALVRTLTDLQGIPWALLSLQSGLLASAGDGEEGLRIWNPQSGLLRAVLDTKNMMSLAQLPKSGLLLAGSSSSTIVVYNPFTQTKVTTFKAFEHGWVSALLALPNDLFVSASNLNTLKVWEPSDFQLVSTLVGHLASVSDLALLNNNEFASSSCDGTINVWAIPS